MRDGTAQVPVVVGLQRLRGPVDASIGRALRREGDVEIGERRAAHRDSCAEFGRGVRRVRADEIPVGGPRRHRTNPARGERERQRPREHKRQHAADRGMRPEATQPWSPRAGRGGLPCMRIHGGTIAGWRECAMRKPSRGHARRVVRSERRPPAGLSQRVGASPRAVRSALDSEDALSVGGGLRGPRVPGARSRPARGRRARFRSRRCRRSS